MRWLRRILIAAVVAYIAALGALFAMQRSLLYPASERRSTAIEAGLDGVQDLAFTTPDGETLVGWWKPPQPGKAVILYFHGNGGSLWNRRNRVRTLTEDGRGLLLVSYRGYSGSTGSPTEEGLRIDARTAYDWLAKSFQPQRIVLYGESLGTGVAVRLATERPVGGVILDAPFTSTADIAQGLYPFAPVSLLMLDQFRSVDVIKDIDAPLLVMHGDADGIVPFPLGERLFAAAEEPKRFLRLEDVNHVSVLERGGLPAVREFLSEVEARLEGGAG